MRCVTNCTGTAFLLSLLGGDFFFSSCISIYHNAKKKHAKRVLYFHLEQQHLDSPKDSNCSNHEKVILCASVVPFIQASHSTSQTLALIVRGPMHMDHPTQEFIPLGSANQDCGALRGSGVVHLHARRVSCSISIHECILRYLLIFKSELLESGDCVSIFQTSLVCHLGAIPTTGTLKAQKAKEK